MHLPTTTEELSNALQPLVGLPLRCLGRAANLLWVHFGELRESLSPRGQLRTVGEWALHIQCPWRIRQGTNVVVASGEFCYGSAGEALDDWDKPGKSKFDVTAATLENEFSAFPPSVTSIYIDEVGGFTIELTNDYRLDIFPDRSTSNTEHWRLFQPGIDHRHFVFPMERSDGV
jgi:hypothetical protein